MFIRSSEYNRQYYSEMPSIIEMAYAEKEHRNLGAYVTVTLDGEGQDFPTKSLKVFPWTRVVEFKQSVAALTKHLAPAELRLHHKNLQLKDDNKTLLDYNISAASNIALSVRRAFPRKQIKQGMINAYQMLDPPDPRVCELLQKCMSSIENGQEPALTTAGTSGSYSLENSNSQKIALFKPYDEEVNAPNNPKGYENQLGFEGFVKGILSGECATREVAAYLLDSLSQNFHKVPTTTYVQFYHPSFPSKEIATDCPDSSTLPQVVCSQQTKYGSLQDFVLNNGTVGDFGSSRFPASEIHKVGLLDLRILNCDRNDGNILVTEHEGQIELTPIDHGLSFPDSLEIDEQSLVWMSYSQSKLPFSQSEIEFVSRINPKQDSQRISEKLGFRSICLRNFRLAETFLKLAVLHGFTLYEIGKMVCRTHDYDCEEDHASSSRRSDFEKIVIQAQSLYINVQEEEKENIVTIDEPADNNWDLGTQAEVADSWRALKLKKKISLPTLKKRTTSYYEQKQQARKQREGVNGVSKTVWNRYEQENWSELFYHYFENLLQTFLKDRLKGKEMLRSCKNSNQQS